MEVSVFSFLIPDLTNGQGSHPAYSANSYTLKGTVARDFYPPFFFHESTTPGLFMNRLKQFRKIFRFRGDIRKNGVSAYYSNTRTRCMRTTVICGHAYSKY